MKGIAYSKQSPKSLEIRDFTAQFTPIGNNLPNASFYPCSATADSGYGSPTRCPDHEHCFYCDSQRFVEDFIRGHWKLSVPLTLPDNGYNLIIKHLHFDGMYQHNLGGTAYRFSSYFRFLGSPNVQIYRSPEYPVKDFTLDTFNPMDFPLNIDAGGYNTFDIDLYQECAFGLLSGRLTMHLRNLIIKGIFSTTVPSPTYTVEVTVKNRQTSVPIQNALVRIVGSAGVVAQNYTDSSGKLIAYNIKLGGYTLSIQAPGYDPSNEAIYVDRYLLQEAFLTPALSAPLPWWVLPVIGGVIIIVGGIIIFGALKKKTPQFLVIK